MMVGNFPTFASKRLGKPCLLQRFIGGVAGFRAMIDSEMPVGERAEPYVMIALAMPHEIAARCGQQFFQFSKESSHAGSVAGVGDLRQVLGHDMHRDFRHVGFNAV